MATGKSDDQFIQLDNKLELGTGCASVRALASEESSHVGHAGVGVVSMKDAPLSLPTFATAQFKRFFLTVVVRFGACCLLRLVGSCIIWFCMDIRVLILMLSSLL